MNILKKISNKLIWLKVDLHVKKAKYIHLMFNDKFNKPYVDFINKNFNKKDHLVLCRQMFQADILHPLPKGNNVFVVQNFEKINLEQDNIEKIFLHSLFDIETVNLLYNHPKLLEKSYWIIWGGDLYSAPNDEKNNFIRNNMKAYIACVKGDEKIAADKYSSKALLFSARYAGPIDLKELDEVKQIKKDYIQIQINNSCDETTLEMLDILSKFKNEKIKIITILSYGQTQFKQEIINKGCRIFKEKFGWIENSLKPKDFVQHLSENDILVLNQNRQQGGGNIAASAYLGKKIFIKSEITSYKNMLQKGVKIFDTNSIKNLSFDEFIDLDNETKRKNIAAAKLIYDNQSRIKSWQDIFAR